MSPVRKLMKMEKRCTTGILIQSKDKSLRIKETINKFMMMWIHGENKTNLQLPQLPKAPSPSKTILTIGASTTTTALIGKNLAMLRQQV